LSKFITEDMNAWSFTSMSVRAISLSAV